MPDFISKLIAEVLDAFAPLAEALESEDGLAALLTEFGWKLGDGANLAELNRFLDDFSSTYETGMEAAGVVLESLDAGTTPTIAEVRGVSYFSGTSSPP